MIDKFVHSMADAMTGIADGSTILLGGFGDVGIPTPLLDGLIVQGARDLTIVAVAGGRDGSAIERLLSLGRVRRLICSFVRPASNGSIGRKSCPYSFCSVAVDCGGTYWK